MIALLIICFVIPMMNCQNCSFKEDEILEINKLFKETVNMRDVGENNNAAICIGSARCGKSTLINYLIDNELIVQETKFEKNLVKADENSLGPEIASSSVSKTMHPTKWISKNLSNLTIWDTPGFKDNRGAIQDLTNAFRIHRLMKNIKYVKFIVVISFEEIIGDFSGTFTTLLNSLEELFGEKFENIFDSITIIFSKVPFVLFDQKVDHEFINTRIMKYVSAEIALSSVAKNFLHYILNNRDHVGIFRKPESNKDLFRINDNIFPAIENSQFISQDFLDDSHPAISSVTKVCLYKIQKNILSFNPSIVLENVFLLLGEKIKKLNNSTINENEEKITEIEKKLLATEQVLLDALSTTQKFDKRIQLIETIDVRIKNIVEKMNLSNYYELIAFIDYCLNTRVSKVYENKLERLLYDLIDQIRESIDGTNVIAENAMEAKHKKELKSLGNQLEPVILALRKLVNDAKEEFASSSEEDEEEEEEEEGC